MAASADPRRRLTFACASRCLRPTLTNPTAGTRETGRGTYCPPLPPRREGGRVGRHEQGHRMRTPEPRRSLSGGTCPSNPFRGGRRGRSRAIGCAVKLDLGALETPTSRPTLMASAPATGAGRPGCRGRPSRTFGVVRLSGDLQRPADLTPGAALAALGLDVQPRAADRACLGALPPGRVERGAAVTTGRPPRAAGQCREALGLAAEFRPVQRAGYPWS